MFIFPSWSSLGCLLGFDQCPLVRTAALLLESSVERAVDGIVQLLISEATEQTAFERRHEALVAGTLNHLINHAIDEALREAVLLFEPEQEDQSPTVDKVKDKFAPLLAAFEKLQKLEAEIEWTQNEKVMP